MKSSSEFKYLGYIVQRSAKSKAAKKHRLMKTKASCLAQLGVLKTLANIPLERKACIVQACVIPVACYGAECGTKSTEGKG